MIINQSGRNRYTGTLYAGMSVCLLCSKLKKTDFRVAKLTKDRTFFSAKVVHFTPEWVVHFHRNRWYTLVRNHHSGDTIKARFAISDQRYLEKVLKI
jgi:hypothetical protein